MATNVIELLIKAQDLASAELKKVGNVVDGVKDKLAPFKTQFFLAGGAIAAAGVASIKMAGDLEQSLNVFKSVSGATAAQMQLVSEKAKQLGNDAKLPGISARDAAEAMTQLAKAGVSVNDTLAASKAVLSLAKAGQLEVADAANITAQALNAFKLKGTDAAKVADALSAGANASAADVSGMALALQQSAAVANQFGVSLNDTVTALAVFANRGIQGSDAGTSLKTMLIALASPSKQAGDLMKQLGLKTYDASGKFVGMRQFALNLQSSLKGLTQEQQNTALATIFGTDAFRAAAFLADSAGKSYDSMATQIGKVGAATDLAAAQNSGFNGALDNMRSTLETIGTTIASKALPGLTHLLNGIASRLPDFAEAGVTLANRLEDGFEKRLQQAKTIGGIFLANIRNSNFEGAGKQIGDMIVNGLKSIKARTKTIYDTFVELMDKVDWVGVGLNLGKKVIPGFVVGLAAGILNLDFGALLKQAGKHWGDIVLAIITIALAPAKVIGAVAKALERIPFIGTLLAWLLRGAKTISDKLFSIGKTIVTSFFKGFVDALGFSSPKVLPALIGFIKALPGQVATFVSGMYRLGVQFVEAFGRAIGEAGPRQVVQGFQLIRLRIGLILADIGKFMADGFAGIIEFLKTPISALGDFFAAIFNGIKGILSGIVDAVVAVVNYFLGWIKTIGTLLSAPAAFIRDIFVSAFNGIKTGFANVWDFITNLFNGARGFFGNVWTGVKDSLSGPANAIKNTFNDMFDGIKNVAKSSINWVIDRVNDMIGAVNGVASKVHGPQIGKIGRLASGTPNFFGGLTMVGERGPELVTLPQGSRVMSNTQTRQAMGGTGTGTVINIEKFEAKSDMDIKTIAREIAWQLAVKRG